MLGEVVGDGSPPDRSGCGDEALASGEPVSADGPAQALPSLPIVGDAPTAHAPEPTRRLPRWLKRPIPAAGGMYFTKELIGELGLETICESARCPNRSECWTRRTATFMILGEVCTRPCGFCAVKRGHPAAVALDKEFANDLESSQLWAVSASSNRSKGDADPANWLPPLESSHCDYVVSWIEVKHVWDLSVDPAEETALREVLESC